MPEHAEHGVASSQPKFDTSQSLSTPSNAPPSGPPGSPFMPWGWMTAIPTKPSPLDLTMDRGESFKLWKRRWESFFRLSYLDAQPPMMQYDVLMSCLADDTLKVVDNFDLAASDKKHDLTTIINALERYAKGQKKTKRSSTTTCSPELNNPGSGLMISIWIYVNCRERTVSATTVPRPSYAIALSGA